MEEGMIFTIEPVLKFGTPNWKIWDDKWTVQAKDRNLSAQTEHTILILKNGVEILTAEQGEERIFVH